MIKQLVENNTIMMNIFKKTNVLLKRVDHQIDKLLNYRHDIYFDFDHMMQLGRGICLVILLLFHKMC